MLKAPLARVTVGLALAGLFLQALAMPVQGAAAGATGGSGGGGDCGGYYHQSIVQATGVISAGDIELWSTVPLCNDAHSNTQVFQWAGRMSGPPILTATSPSGANFAWSITGATGCTVGTITNLIDSFAAASGLSGTATITLTANECRFLATFTLTLQVAAVTVFQTRQSFAHNIDTTGVQTVFACGAPEVVANSITPSGTACDTPQNNNLEFLCAATGASAESFAETQTCSPPTINTVVSGTLGLTGTLNAVLSGAVSLSGGLTVSDDSGGWAIHQDAISGALTLSGSLNTAVSGSLATTVSGGLTITDDANGWAVHQDPITGTLTVSGVANTTAALQSIATAIQSLNRLRMQVCGDVGDVEAGACSPLNAALSGALTVHQDPICTASSHCFQDISGLTINQTMGNVSVVVPSETTTHLCGPVINTSACSPVASAATISSVEAAHWLPIIAILAVLLAGIFWANPLLITLGIIGFPVYFATISPVKELGWLAMIMLSILAPAIARFYANYKARMERGAPI